MIGDVDWIVIYAVKTPDPQALPMSADGQPLPDGSGPVPGDIRRISYWLGANGGLCRQEIPWFSSDLFDNTDTIVYEDGKSDDDYLLAREVIDLTFEYYDINAEGDDQGWTESWDGTQPGPDGVTPLGPPTAIRVSFTLKVTDAVGNTTTKDYKHVIPILTANGPDTSSMSGGGMTAPTGP